MHTRILYGYLILTTGAHFAEFYVAREIALSIFVTLVAVRWVVVPMLCNCAKRIGAQQSLRALIGGDPHLTIEPHTPSTDRAYEDRLAIHR